MHIVLSYLYDYNSKNFLNHIHGYQLFWIESNILLHKFTPSSFLHLYPAKSTFIYMQFLCIFNNSESNYCIHLNHYTYYKTVKVELLFIIKNREFTDIIDSNENINFTLYKLFCMKITKKCTYECWFSWIQMKEWWWCSFV